MTLYPGGFQFLAENPPHLFTIVINWDSSFNFFPKGASMSLNIDVTIL